MPLTPQQLQHLEARLREERAALQRQVEQFSSEESRSDSQELAGDLSKMPVHMADLGTDVHNEELEVTLVTRRSAELAEIDAALDRITTSPDTFGLDEQTGEEIPFERLDAIPYARTTVPPSPITDRSST
jgi:RNA polymerase-binding transcription factor DksA